MGKRKLGNGKGSGTASISNDENADGWLSTRNKKKISPPQLKAPGARRFLSRPFPRSPLVVLMEEAPLQLKSSSKQTSIMDFLNPPRLQPLPPQGDAVRAVNSHPHEGDQHQDNVKLCGEEDLMYSDFDMSCSTPTEDSVRDVEADATPHSFCCSQPERVISPVSLDMTSKRQIPGVPPSAGPKAAPPSAGPMGGSRRQLESSHACAENPDRDRSTGSRDTGDEHHGDELKAEQVKETGTAETSIELYPPQPEGTLSASAGEDAEGGAFADSLQTPRFLQNTHGSLDLDEPTLKEIPTLPASNFAPKLNSEKHRGSSSDDDRNLQFSNMDPQESYKRAGETTKREYSSLELNVNCCGSSQESVTGEVVFNDSLLTPSFPDSDKSDGEDCEAITKHEVQAVVSVRKRSPSSILHPWNEKIFIDDLHTPVFLKNVHGDSSSAGNC